MQSEASRTVPNSSTVSFSQILCPVLLGERQLLPLPSLHFNQPQASLTSALLSLLPCFPVPSVPSSSTTGAGSLTGSLCHYLLTDQPVPPSHIAHPLHPRHPCAILAAQAGLAGHGLLRGRKGTGTSPRFIPSTSCFALLCFALLCFALLCSALLCFALLVQLSQSLLFTPDSVNDSLM